MERGLAGPDESGELTEFLVAPLQPKGAERGNAKQWVDRVRRERESQETRRVLYVAATRARDELHLFARPAYKTEKNLARSLVEPKDSLLAVAWPAFEEEIRKRFDAWTAAKAEQDEESATIKSIAAAGDNLSVMPLPAQPTRRDELRRLPPGFRTESAEPSSAAGQDPLPGMGLLYERHEGGLLSRALGKAVHALLDQLSQLLAAQSWQEALAALPRLQPRIAAEVRAAGIDPSHAGRIAAHALQIALQAAADPVGQWILSPHAEAASEVRWAGVVAGSLRTVEVDRVFRAASAPQPNGQHADKDTWWIIDYKTAHEDGLDPAAALPALRRIFAPQIEAYAKVLRNLHGADAPVCAGLYYPRMMQFDWWKL
jgi:ATP-dependent exoDNAse (exonuclease V) beta subunit